MNSSVPLTYNRARTAIVQSRSHLLKARTEMRLAVEILQWLDDAQVPWPRERSERQELVRLLQRLLARIERTERTLSRAWRPAQAQAGPDPGPAAADGNGSSRAPWARPMQSEALDGRSEP
ncbi:MAG TPA: hypothetical protein VNO34_00575 [Actinomycetota bacterium]|nr:hypothetical protein [Actinomycetota bacterium]